MKTRLSCYEDTLLHLTQYNCLTRKALLLMNYSNIAVYDAITKGLRAKTIKENVLQYRKGKGASKYQVTYFTITRKGLQLLCDTCADKCQWLAYMPEAQTVCIKRTHFGSASNIVNFLRMTSAAMMSEAMGAETPDLFLSFQAIKTAPLLGEQGLPGNDDADAMWMLDGLDDFIDEAAEAREAPAQSTIGLSWQRKLIQQEIQVVRMFSKLCSTYHSARIDSMDGILIVQNEKMLEDIFTMNQRGKTRLGSDLEHLWVVPMNKDGAKDMEWVMMKDWGKQQQKLIDAAIASGIYEHNDSTSMTTIFPLKTKDGTQMANGTLIDAKHINKIMMLTAQYPDMKYGIICREYQYPYYQRILPNAICMLVR